MSSHDYAGCQDSACDLCGAYGDGGFASKVHKNEVRSGKAQHGTGCPRNSKGLR